MIRRKRGLSSEASHHSVHAFSLLQAARNLRQAAETFLTFGYDEYARRARALAKTADKRRRLIMKKET